MVEKEYSQQFPHIDGVVPLTISAATGRLTKPDELRKAVQQVRSCCICLMSFGRQF